MGSAQCSYAAVVYCVWTCGQKVESAEQREAYDLHSASGAVSIGALHLLIVFVEHVEPGTPQFRACSDPSLLLCEYWWVDQGVAFRSQ